MEVVGNGLLHWNPLQHRDLEVRLYREYPLPRSADVFKNLRLSPGIADDKWLLAQTARAAQTAEAGDLHLTNEETVLLRQKPMSPSDAWQQILQRRSEALARGGLAAVPPYGPDKSISPGSEFRGLLSLAPKAARHFQPSRTRRSSPPGQRRAKLLLLGAPNCRTTTPLEPVFSRPKGPSLAPSTALLSSDLILWHSICFAWPSMAAPCLAVGFRLGAVSQFLAASSFNRGQADDPETLDTTNGPLHFGGDVSVAAPTLFGSCLTRRATRPRASQAKRLHHS